MFTIVVSPGLICIHGRETVAEAHRHHALQISVGLDEKFRFECEKWSGRCEGVIVAPDVLHRLEGGHGRALIMLLDPEHAHSKRFAERYLGERCFAEVPPELVDRLRRYQATTLDTRRIPPPGIDGLMGFFMPQSVTNSLVDERIQKTTDYLIAAPGRKTPASDLARRVGLSESRLAHLFKQEIGISIRRYAMWLRLIHAMKLAAAGLSLTQAANEAGFSDSAHLTRTFREMFGIQPSVVLQNSRFIQAHTSDAS